MPVTTRPNSSQKTNKQFRPSPTESATLYTVGKRKMGNDGFMWIVSVDTLGRKSWKKIIKVSNNKKVAKGDKVPSTVTLKIAESDFVFTNLNMRLVRLVECEYYKGISLRDTGILNTGILGNLRDYDINVNDVINEIDGYTDEIENYRDFIDWGMGMVQGLFISEVIKKINDYNIKHFRPGSSLVMFDYIECDWDQNEEDDDVIDTYKRLDKLSSHIVGLSKDINNIKESITGINGFNLLKYEMS